MLLQRHHCLICMRPTNKLQLGYLAHFTTCWTLSARTQVCYVCDLPVRGSTVSLGQHVITPAA